MTQDMKKRDMKSKHIIRFFFLVLVLFMSAASETWARETLESGGITVYVDMIPSDGGTVGISSVSAITNGKRVTFTISDMQSGYSTSADLITAEPMVSLSATRTAPGLMDPVEVTEVTGSENTYSFDLPSRYTAAFVTIRFTYAGGVIPITSLDAITDPAGKYEIVSDINASGFTTSIANFTGTLSARAKSDGTFPVISNLSVPLFTTATGATICNIMLKSTKVSGSGPVGAICGTASGYTRIYNCGILPTDNKYVANNESSFVKSTGGYCGGLIGWLKDDSRVINCFSYANITGGTDVAGIVGHNEAASNTTVTDGKYASLRTAVVNCMFYGNISDGTNRYPVYGGAKMSNTGDYGINNYDFYRAEASVVLDDAHYNCSWPALEEYLTQYEFYRNLLNSNRELCGWWVGAESAPSTLTTDQVQAVPKDASLMAKWVLDPSIAPYPILKSAGFYKSPVNHAPRPDETNPQRIDPETKLWVSRGSSTNTEMKNPNDAPETDGRSLGKIRVTIKKNADDTGTGKDIIITAMDIDNNDFCYGKIQLPYYNSIYGDPTVQIDPTATAEQKAAQWNTRYGGNYGDNVVVGWEITDVTGGTAGTLTKDWQTGYNFVDRNCTNKDKERVFAQGGYYYVPYGVSAITITAKWATAIYLDNGSDHSYDRVNFANLTAASAGTHFAPAGKRSTTLGNGKTVVTGKIKDNIPTGSSVYEKAIVLVGNHQYRVGNDNIGSGSTACTIMSADFDLDDEPDYSLLWQLGQDFVRKDFCPIRFDFIPVTELGLAMKLDGSTQYFSLGSYRPLGHFEVTETSLIHFGQFEFSNKDRTIYAPLILNGGIYDQYTKGHQTYAFKKADDKIDYVIVGGNVRMPSFTPGAHVNTNASYPTRHCAVNVLGGSIDNLYLTGNYNNGVTPNTDNPHCYIDGGNFKQVAAAGKEGIDGDVYFNINHSIINEFYGGSTLADKLVTGNINVTINNSYVTKYCGGPKFGNMSLSDSNPENNKTVKTDATGTTFGVYYGGGNGGTSYVQYGTPQDNTVAATGYNWNGINSGQGHVNDYSPSTYINKATGYQADYEMEIVNVSTGTKVGQAVHRTYFYAAQFSATNTGPITNNLTDCKILTNFYGGGNLGGVKGNVTSKLMGTTRVDGSVFGAGYSASIPEVTIYNRDKTPPTINVYTGIITPTPEGSGTSTTYTWTNKTSLGGNTLSTSNPKAMNVEGVNYLYTEESLDNLGSVSGTVTLNVEGTATVAGSVYGGGEESGVDGDTEVTVKGGTIGAQGNGGVEYGNVYGGGKGKRDNVTAGLVKGNTKVTIENTKEENGETILYSPTIYHNVYGGGAYGSVGTYTYDANNVITAHTENTGKTEVYIKGGTFGWNGKENGMVFGSSRGDVGAEGAIEDKLAWVYDTKVYIGNEGSGSVFGSPQPQIKGSIYGGGENGHNLNNADVYIYSGTIGISEGEPVTSGGVEYSGAAYPYRGNVYGGGCGTDKYYLDPTSVANPYDGNGDKYNPKAGIVQGNATVNISGGHIVHNVYGAGAMGSVGTADVATSGKTTVTVSGGRIGYDGDRNGNVFGATRGEYGISTDLSKNLANVRESEVNISYTTTPIADNDGKTAQLIAGSVFGGGESGTVKESVSVNMTGGLILKDLYGGGALADTQTSNWDASANNNAGGWANSTSKSALHTTTVRLTGGMVEQEVFGGGLGEAGRPAYVWGDVLVDLNGTTTMSDGKATTNGTASASTAKGCVVREVFGCNNTNGTPKGDVMVHVFGTQHKDQDAISQKYNVPAPQGSTESLKTYLQRLIDATKSGEGYINGVTASVITAAQETCNNSSATDEQLNAAIANVLGQIDVMYDVSAVYGGGNNAAYVPVTPNTVIGDTPNGSRTQVVIEGCDYTSIQYVYGGGNAAPVPDTYVTVKGTKVIDYVFGGGNGTVKAADVGYDGNGNNQGNGNANTTLIAGTIHNVYGASNTNGDIRGKANIIKTDKGNTDSGCCDNLVVNKMYAAGKDADISGGSKIILGCMPEDKIYEYYGGAENANVLGDVELTITSGKFGKVFGGNKTSGAILGHIIVNIEETGCRPIEIDELYGCGNNAPYSVYGFYDTGNTNPSNGKKIFAPRTSATDTHKPVHTDGTSYTSEETFTAYDSPVVNIISATSISKVFGGGYGSGATVYGSPTVNINMIKGAFSSGIDAVMTAMELTASENPNKLGIIGDVFGGGNAANVYGVATVNIGMETTVQLHQSINSDGTYQMGSNNDVLGAYITGNVFGGGNKADVIGDTKVNICGTQNPDSESENGYTDTFVSHSGTTGFDISIGNSVYGGGSEADVLGNTFVTMADGYVFNGIFGGGLAGSVGTYERSTNVTDWGHTANHDGCIGKPTACTSGGTCYVVVSGGQIGPIEVATEGMARLDAAGGPVPQGWVWGAGCGIVEDPATHPDTHFKAYVNNTDVTIKRNAFILESIIGGGEFGRVLGNTLVKIKGGQIGVGEGMVDNGKPVRYTDGQFIDPTTTTVTTGLATCSHFPFGKEVGGKKVYECYDPYADAYKAAHQGSELYSGGVTDYASDGKTWIGCVFAGGSGYMPYVHRDGSNNVTDYDWVSSAGWVEGNTEVRISGGHILTNVYGGNEYTDVKGTSKVIMTGGTVGVPRTKEDIEALPMCGYIFGAGKGDERTHFNTATNVGYAEVEVSGGIVYGSVYGGGEDGHVLHDVKVTIKDGAIIGTCGTSYFDGHVFGGGRGLSGIAQTAGTVGGNVTLNIEGGTMLGSIYGGGRLASVGTQFTAPDDENYGNFVEDSNGKTYGHVEVNISGGTIGKSFTPDDEGNLPDGAEHSGNVFGGSMGRLDLLNGTRISIWPKMAQVKESNVNIYGDATINRNVYGGGELGSVRDNAYVTIGGEKKADADTDGNVTVDPSGSPTVGLDVYGGGYGSIDRNYTVFTVKELEDDEQYHDHTYAFTPMQFAGCVGKNTYVNVVGGKVKKSVYGGGEMASVGVINYRATTESDANKVTIGTIGGITYYYENVFKHEDPTKEFALSWPYKFEYVPGYYGATHVKVKGGRLGDDSVGTDNGDVYGAGKGKAGDYKDFVFCANVGSTDVQIAYNSTPTAYSGTLDCIAGAVYGGGEDGHVMGNTKLTISGGLIYHSVYGGGSGKGKFTKTLDKTTNVTSVVTNNALNPEATRPTQTETTYEASCYSITAGKVFGNTEIVMTGGYVVRNVYGGGNMGSVGKGNYAGGDDDYSTNGYGEKVTNLWSNEDFLNSGKCTVKISGGTIGYIDSSDPSNSMYPWNTSASLPYGNVFGGCRGESAPNITDSPRYLYSPEFFVGYANETEVTIEGSTKILGSVYGGGMDGHVRRDAHVIIKGGEIGIPFTDDNKNNVVKTSDPNDIQWMARGNVYGAGSGVGKYKYDFNYDGDYLDEVTYKMSETRTVTTKEEDFSTSAGSVTRFTKVDIQGGTIYRNVYGGGSLSSVGAPKIGQDYDEYRKGDTAEGHGQGKQTLNEVIISGGHIGDANSYDANDFHVYGGMVYGGSRGDLDLGNAFSTALYTSVNVSGTADIKGDVFGGGEAGTVKGSVDVTMNGGTVNHDVYGGGALADTQTNNWDATANNNTGDWATGKTSASYTTLVSLKGGTIAGDAYGGGLGEVATTSNPDGNPAYVYGDVKVELNKNITTGNAASTRGCSVNRIFGCNNLNGTPKGKVQVYVNATQNTGSEHVLPKGDRHTGFETLEEGQRTSYEVTAVYGGGNLSPYEPKDVDAAQTEVYIDGCGLTSIKYVYGGGNAAAAPATYVRVNGAYEIEELFAGGNGKDNYVINGEYYVNPGANVGYKNYTYLDGNGDGSKGSPYNCTEYDNAKDKEGRQTEANGYMYGSGIAHLETFGGYVHAAYGGSNEKGNVRYQAWSKYEEGGTCDLQVLETYGGGKNSEIDGEIKLDLGCTTYMPEIFGGSKNADVNSDIVLNIANGRYDNVFGGNNTSGNIYGSITVNIKENGCVPINIENLYLGGYLAGYSIYGYYQDAEDGNKWKPRTKEQYNALSETERAAITVRQNPRINVISATRIGNIFGGGYQATVVGDPHVNVNMEQGRVEVSKKEVVLGEGQDMPQNAFEEDGKTYIYKDGGANTYPKGKVSQDTESTKYFATLDIGTIGNVYGGGNEADIIGDTYVEIGTGTYHDTNGNLVAITPARNAATITGDVYGGGKGKADTFTCEKAMVGIENSEKGSTYVTIENGTVSGNVYGGGQIGRVEANTNVTIGKAEDETNELVIHGDVFGAGKGLETHGYSALVRGHATVTIQGKTKVEGSVYGGGEIATVGRFYVKNVNDGSFEHRNEYNVPDGMPYALIGGGDCTVTVQDNAEISGDVFGAGKGKEPDKYDYYTKEAFLAIEGNTEDDYNINNQMPKRMVDYNNTKHKTSYGENEEVIIWAPYENDANFVWEYFDTQEKYHTFLQTLALVNEPHVTIDGSAQVNGNVYGGSESGFVLGTTYATIQGSSTIGTTGTTETDGNVFGGGLGLVSFAEAGLVKGNTTVNINGGTIKHNIYGGGKLGSVGTYKISSDMRSFMWTNEVNPTPDNYTYNNTGVCNVTITGGEIGITGVAMNDEGSFANGNVFGGGKGKDDTFWCEKGIVYKANVNVNGGTVNGNVYGGGEVGRVETDATVKIGPDTGTASPDIKGNVFGGGAGVKTHGYSALVRGNTYVTAQSSAQVGHNVYGGGQIAAVGKYYLVTAENQSQHPGLSIGMPYSLVNDELGICNVTVIGNSTITGSVFGGGKGKEPEEDLDFTAPENNQTDKYHTSSYDIDYHMPKRMMNDYAGKNSYWEYYNPPKNTIIWEYFDTPEKYHTFLETLGLTTQSRVTIGGTRNENGKVTASGSPTINGNVYGGSESGFVQHNTSVAIAGGTIGTTTTGGNVFGGGLGLATFAEAGRVRGNATVTISAGVVKGNVYGGGQLGDVGTINKTLANYNYKWTDDAVSIDDPADKSYSYNNTGLCTVNINGGTIGTGVTVNADGTYANGNVFGAGKGLEDTWWCEKAIAYNTNVNITEGTINGTVYGGGQVGRVENNSVVTIGTANEAGTGSKPNIIGNVFGAGAGVATHGYSALLRGNSEVTVQGIAQVGGSVYGGGEIASVGRFEVVGGLPTKPESGGTCKVTIQDNAKIGSDDGTEHSVFGACKGVTPAYDEENYKSVYSVQTVANTPAGNEGDTWDYYDTGKNYIKRYYKTETDYLDFLKTLALTSHPHVIIAEDATIFGSVYGGGQRGVTLGSVDVDIVGGTVKKDVYGGGALADTNKGNWDENNYVLATALNEGESITDLYTRTNTGTTEKPVYKYTKITDSNATLGNDTYRRVPTWATDKYNSTTHATTYKTNVTLTGGTIKRNVYGGGLGQIGREASATVTEIDEVKAKVYGDVLVSLNGTKTPVTTGEGESATTTYVYNDNCVVEGNIFGCNNQNGSPQSAVTVHVYKTKGWEGHTGTARGKLDSENAGDHSYHLTAVYGGGNLSAYYPDLKATRDTVQTYVIIDGCDQTSIKQVYGGGNAASTPATNVTVNASYEIEEVFGGGNGLDDITINDVTMKNPGANVGYEAYPTSYDPPASSKEERIANFSYGSGKASVNIYDGLIHRVFGGSNTKGNVRESAVTILQNQEGCHFQVDEAYGGGKSAPMDADAKLLMACIPGLKVAYGGAQDADIQSNVELNITNGTFDRVFGGNNVSGTIHGTITVNIEETGCRPVIIGQLYGGGNQAAYTAPEGKPGPTVNVKSFTSIGEVFGGGYGETAVVTGNTHVNIDVCKGKFASNAYSETTKTFSFSEYKRNKDGVGEDSFEHDESGNRIIENKTVSVTLPGHAANGIGAIYNVFGGGNAAKVVGNTYVNIGTLSEVDFESDDTDTTEVDESTVPQSVVGVDIRGNVYGGGNQAEVTGNTNVVIGKEKTTTTSTTQEPEPEITTP